MKKTHLLRNIILSATILCCGILLLLGGISSVSENASASQAESLQQAILRSAVNCYATEGAYPESLDYLKEHYGISWNPSKYVVDYEIFSSNLMPSVSVFLLKQ